MALIASSRYLRKVGLEIFWALDVITAG